MSRGEANKVFNNFVGGLNTESSPLTFPENASLDEENMVLSRKGDRQRRLGMDFEDNFVLTDTGKDLNIFKNLALSSHIWPNINDDASVALTVVQIGSDLFFYDLLKSNTSGSIKNGGNPVSLPIDVTQQIQVAAILGRLIIVTGTSTIITLEYDVENDIIISTSRKISIRDFFGVDDSIGITIRPSILTEEHRYNLHNQGWSSGNITAFKSAQGVYPSNADIMHIGKDVDENFDSSILIKNFFGSSPAPKGATIIDAFNRGAERKTGGVSVSWRTPFVSENIRSGVFPAEYITTNFTSTSLLADQTTQGCTAIARYAGRVFYSGAGSDIVDGDSKSPNLGSYIFFTQIMDNMEKATACYSEADPTSEHISDLIASDGGTIKITEASRIIKLITLGHSLVVFADTGVWQIRGGDTGFRATEFQVIKISDIGVTSGESVVAVDSIAFYWAKNGIYVLQPTDSFGILSISNITQDTIQTLYNGIPDIVKQNSIGIYDSAAEQIKWLYSTEADYDGINEKFKFNKELIFDKTLSAFYKHKLQTLSADAPYVGAYLKVPGILSTVVTSNIVSGGKQVIDGVGNKVVSIATVRTRGDRSVKYLTIQPGATYTFTYSFFKNGNFLDWFSSDSIGLDAPAFLITGQETMQDTQRAKKVTYLTMHMERTETGFTGSDPLIPINESSVKVESRWEWANSNVSGRFGKEFQAYRLNRNYIPDSSTDLFDYGFEVVTTRNKLRGKGRALSLKFSTEPGKDFKLLGWATNITGEEKV